MNDSPFTIIGDEPVEARIVAWVLGEASGFEAGELERLCAERPELLVFRRRMRALHGLLTDVEAAQPDEGWKLPPEKRKLLDEVLGAPVPVLSEPVVEKRVRHAARRVLLSIAACVLLTFVVLFFIPADYESEAVIEVKPRTAGVSAFGVTNDAVASSKPGTPQFFATERETIKSRRNLEQVADRLALEKRWNVDRETAITKLKESIRTENIDGTDLISIRARADDPEDAKQIASEVTKSYQNHRLEMERGDEAQALAELNKAVRDQEDKVEERRKLLATIVNTKGIVYKGQNEGRKDSTREEAIKRGLDAQDYVDAKRDFETDQELLQNLKLKKVAADIGSRIPDSRIEVHDDPLKGEPERKSLASNLLGKVSSLGTVLGGKGQADVSRAEAAVASKRVDSLPAARGMIVDQSERERGQQDNGRSLASAPATPAAPPSDTLSTVLPAELIEGTPKPINVPNLEVPQNGPAGVSSLGSHASSTLTLSGASQSTGTVSFADAPEDNFRFSQTDSPEKPVARDRSPSLPIAGAGSVFAAAGDGNGIGGGGGGAAGSRDRRFDDVAEADLKKQFNGYTGSTDTSGGTLHLPLRAGSERSPQDRNSDYFVADENTKTNVRDEGSSVGWQALPPGDAPVLGDLFSGTKQNFAPSSAQRSSDRPLAETEFDGIVQYGAPIGGEHGVVSGLAEREVARRQSGVQDGDRLLMEGRDAYQKGDYQKAREKYSESLAKVPDAPVFADRKDSVEKHLSDADTALAMQARKVGKYSEAKELLIDALEKNPDNTVAKSELSFQEDPIRTNPALTEGQTGKVDEVRRNLYMAEGNMNLGKYDEAKKGYEDTLRIDPYNSAARKGMEQLAAAKSDFYRAAYDHTRAELLMEADKAWESAAPAGEKDGKASIKVIREVSYPTEYEAPQIPAKPDLAKLMEEISAAEDPYSTFSLNVSDASFKIARAALAKGGRPDPAGVKAEQFYNAVDYGDPAPAGGESVALASEQCAHPVIPGRDLVRISVKTAAAGRGAGQPLRITLLVDQSGSMVRADRREAMKTALSSLAGLLTANDRVTLIGFSRTPHLLADGMAGDQAGKLPDMVHQDAAEGGTNLEEAIKLAAQLAARHKQAGAQNRIVLFTDGAANLGDADPSRLAERVKALRQGGFAFDIAGIAADDVNDELLGELARNGNGRYYIVGKGENGDFANRLAGAFRPAAENVKVQVRFNPGRVARYKLIGFEKDRLKTEDFRNDSVDAAEMAAEEAGVAIYQVETIPGGSGELGEVSVRFRDAAAGAMVERTMVLSHTGSVPAIDKASPPMQLAVLSMLAAEKLRGGPLGEAVDFSKLSGPRGNVRGFFGSDGRAAEMLQVIDAIQ